MTVTELESLCEEYGYRCVATLPGYSMVRGPLRHNTNYAEGLLWYFSPDQIEEMTHEKASEMFASYSLSLLFTPDLP